SEATCANIAWLAMIELPWPASGLYTCPGLDASALTETCPSSSRQNAGMTTQTQTGTFHGWNVVGAAFVLAAFGWGVGFYGPPVFLSVVSAARGWPVPLVSAAVTIQFLIGAVAGANLPALYERFGIAAVTKAGALSLAVGVCGWALASTPSQLFVAALL